MESLDIEMCLASGGVRRVHAHKLIMESYGPGLEFFLRLGGTRKQEYTLLIVYVSHYIRKNTS